MSILESVAIIFMVCHLNRCIQRADATWGERGKFGLGQSELNCSDARGGRILSWHGLYMCLSKNILYGVYVNRCVNISEDAHLLEDTFKDCDRRFMVHNYSENLIRNQFEW